MLRAQQRWNQKPRAQRFGNRTPWARRWGKRAETRAPRPRGAKSTRRRASRAQKERPSGQSCTAPRTSSHRPRNMPTCPCCPGSRCCRLRRLGRSLKRLCCSRGWSDLARRRLGERRRTETTRQTTADRCEREPGPRSAGPQRRPRLLKKHQKSPRPAQVQKERPDREVHEQTPVPAPAPALVPTPTPTPAGRLLHLDPDFSPRHRRRLPAVDQSAAVRPPSEARLRSASPAATVASPEAEMPRGRPRFSSVLPGAEGKDEPLGQRSPRGGEGAPTCDGPEQRTPAHNPGPLPTATGLETSQKGEKARGPWRRLSLVDRRTERQSQPPPRPSQQ